MVIGKWLSQNVKPAHPHINPDLNGLINIVYHNRNLPGINGII